MIPEFIRARGEIVSVFLVAILLGAAVRPVADVLGIERRRVGDLFWSAGAAFVLVGRIAYLVRVSPSTLLDPLVLVRVQGGIDTIAATAAVAAVAWWYMRGTGPARAAWAAAAALGLAIATVGYDGTCVVRDACYGVLAPAPLGFRMAGLTETRLPTPLIEAALLLILLSLLLRLWPRLRTAAIAAWTFAALALVRAGLTPASVRGPSAVDGTTLLVALAGVVAVVAGAWVSRRGNRPG